MRELVLGDSLDALLDHRGKTPRKLGGDFVEAGVPVVSAILVRNGRLDLASARAVTAEMHARWMPVPTRQGDVLLTSEAPLGRVARVPSDAPLVLGQRLFGLRGKSGVLDSRYLFYALQSERVQADLVGRSTGTTVLGIRQSALINVRVPAPSHPEQVAIGEILGSLDDKIGANELAIELAGRLAETIVARSVIGTCALSDIALITMGSSPPGVSYNEAGEGLPFHQGVRDFGHRTPRNRVFTTAPARAAMQGDTLLSVRAPVGRVNIASQSLCLGRGLAGVRSTVGTPWTLMHQVASASSWEPYNSDGTVFGAISKQNLASAKVPAIPGHRLAEVEAEVAPLEEAIAGLTLECEELTRTRDALLPLLMSGKLRVKDAERTIEEIL